MSKKIVSVGMKIDLHIHSVFSKFKDGDKVKNNTMENIKTLVEKLNENCVNMVSITDHDYFSFEMYKKLKNEENKGELKKVLPGFEASVEMIGDGGGKEVVHIICIFDDRDDFKIRKINSYLTENNLPKYDLDEKFSEQKFLEIIKDIDIPVIMIGHQKGSLYTKGKNKKNDILTLGKRTFEELVFTDYFDAYEYKNRKNQIYNRLFNQEMRKKISGSDVRFITSSDCHSWEMYPKIDANDKTDEYPYTYLKCLPTFRGLVMAITDYSRIKTVNSFFSNSNKYLENIDYTSNNEKKNIELSKGLNVIIGDNSVGKSMIIHKLSDYNYLKDSSLKSKYEDYMKNSNFSIDSNIDSNNLFSFDRQGNIRDIFEKKTLTASKFLKKHFPSDPNVVSIKSKLFDIVDQVANAISSKFEYEREYTNMTSFEFLHETKSESIIFSGEIEKLTDNMKDIAELLKSIDELINKTVNLSQMKALQKEDLFQLKQHKKYFDNLRKKYFEINEDKKIKNSIIEIIDENIIRIQETRDSIKSDNDKIIQLFENNLNNTRNKIVSLIKLKNQSKEPTLKIVKKVIKPETNIIGKYRFVSKVGIKKIDEDYIYQKLNRPFVKNYSLDISKISEKEFEDKLLKYSFDGTSTSIDFYSKKIKEDIEADFKVENVINEKKEEDVYKQLSSGFNSRIYFDILANQGKNEGLYIIDQPEDDVSQSSIKEFLLKDFKIMAEKRQIIIVTHNPQFIVNLDVDNVIFIQKDKLGNINIKSGALEYEHLSENDDDENYDILNIVANNIDGGIETINRRWKRYDKNINF